MIRRKMLVISVVLVMVVVMLTGATVGYGEYLQGATQDSDSGVTLGGGNVTVVHVQDPGDIPVYDGSMEDQGGYATYGWDADSVDWGWDSAPSTQLDDLYFIKESDGCIAATHANVTATTEIKLDKFDMMDRLETIPVPESNIVGSDYINITIPAFKYTDYNNSAGGSSQQGTFDVVTSYAVFMSEDGGDYTYIGNATNYVDGPDDPLVPMSGEDPTGIDTGHFTFNTSEDGGITLSSGTNYEFKIRVNIGPSEAEGGYDGGLGSYTTWSAGTASDTIQTDPADTPEFGPGMLIPVIAVTGLFVTFTVYRRKKDEE